MKKLFIYCAGGVGREVCDIADRLNSETAQWAEICFIDDTKELETFYEKRIFTYRNFKRLFSPQDCEMVIANGEPLFRQMLYNKVKADNYQLANIIDCTSVVSATAHLDEGIVLYPFTFISSNVHVSPNTLIYNHSVVAHDSLIGSNTVLSIGVKIAGNCTISKNCFIGAGAVVRERVKVGEWSIVGMGSAICHSLPSDGIYMGNPAARKKENIDRKVFH
ncbi:MAG: NeuD/PglB/VioB family sugar acetyltransferase [Oscillospiraceae bacterium]|jgi:sugar O-acyltransferase (sialic acid O-acetyltransferase NeuD family)|nr:NeuD/PglB/VioB family sugar acetyltransferase [Oscillospiraceae bacterium]